MEYWLDTTETIPDGLGFSHFDSTHLAWLGAFVLFALASCLVYRRLGTVSRKRMRLIYAGLIVADEVFLLAVLFIGDRFLPTYLPLHLCSINLFIIAYHAFRPGKMLDNFLYAICLPGALAALLFPSWTELPQLNAANLHSFTFHFLLAAYPLMLLAGGDIRPEVKYVPKCLALLAGLALMALAANLVFGTNFMFLMRASKGNPLYWFQQRFGSHLVGFPIIIAAVIAALYGPGLIRRRPRP